MSNSSCPRTRLARLEHRSGFTLVEVMLVLVVVSIITGMVVLAIPAVLGRSGDLARESERVATLLDMACDESVLQGIEIGFAADQNGYRFFRLDQSAGKWQSLAEEPFQARTLDEEITLDLSVEGRAIVLGDESATPPVLLLSSGETTPFELRIALRGGEEERLVTSDGFSGIHLEDPSARDED